MDAAVADRRVLGGQPEGVVAHRAQDAVAAPAAEMGDDVSDRVVQDVAHVQLARGVRQHLDDVGLGALDLAGLGIGRVERARVLPDALPALLDFFGSYFSVIWVVSGYKKASRARGPAEALAAPPRSPPVLRKKLRSCHCSTI